LHLARQREGHHHLRAVELQVVDRADLHAGDPDRRARLEQRDIGKPRVQRVLLPEEPALAAQQEDHEGGDGNGRDRQRANLQFRPGKRSCSRHDL
jgi:hypothetical protein